MTLPGNLPPAVAVWFYYCCYRGEFL
jgi:hypothetical protein